MPKAEDVQNILTTPIPKGTPVKVDTLGRGMPGRTLTIIAYHGGIAYAAYLDANFFTSTGDEEKLLDFAEGWKAGEEARE